MKGACNQDRAKETKWETPKQTTAQAVSHCDEWLQIPSNHDTGWCFEPQPNAQKVGLRSCCVLTDQTPSCHQPATLSHPIPCLSCQSLGITHIKPQHPLRHPFWQKPITPPLLKWHQQNNKGCNGKTRLDSTWLPSHPCQQPFTVSRRSYGPWN